MRVSNKSRPVFTDRPFLARGVSLYVRDQLPIIYRVQRVVSARAVQASGTHPYAAAAITNTTRVAFQAGVAGDPISINEDISAYAPGTVYLDLAHCAGGVENQHRHPQKFTLDASGDPINEILGRGISAGYEARSGGIVRFHFRYIKAVQGVQPVTFELRRTAGPTTPTALSITASGSGLYSFNSLSLADSATYTFQVIAINGATEKILLTDTGVQADNTGPPAPSNLVSRVI